MEAKTAFMSQLLPPKAMEQFDNWLTAYNVTDWEKLPDFVKLAYYKRHFKEIHTFDIFVTPYSASKPGKSTLKDYDETYSYFIYKEQNHVHDKVDFENEILALTAAVIKAGEIIEERLK